MRDTGEPQRGYELASTVLAAAGRLRSARVIRHLRALRAKAVAYQGEPLMRQLAVDIDTALCRPEQVNADERPD